MVTVREHFLFLKESNRKQLYDRIVINGKLSLWRKTKKILKKNSQVKSLEHFFIARFVSCEMKVFISCRFEELYNFHDLNNGFIRNVKRITGLNQISELLCAIYYQDNSKISAKFYTKRLWNVNIIRLS